MPFVVRNLEYALNGAISLLLIFVFDVSMVSMLSLFFHRNLIPNDSNLKSMGCEFTIISRSLSEGLNEQFAVVERKSYHSFEVLKSVGLPQTCPK